MAAFLVLLVLVLAGCAGSNQPDVASAPPPERKPWNAEEMTALTGDLAQSVREVREAWRREPLYRSPTTANRAALQLDQKLRELDGRASQLHSRVEAGGGYDETFNIVRNIGVLLNDVDVLARRIRVGSSMVASVRPTAVLLNEIAPFYGIEPLYDPSTLQRIDRGTQR